MTEQRKALDSALELLVYLPVGLAVTAGEEFPRVAAKGKQRVESQIAVARVVGQFAVHQARRVIDERLGQFRAPSDSEDFGDEAVSGKGVRGDEPLEADIVTDSTLDLADGGDELFYDEAAEVTYGDMLGGANRVPEGAPNTAPAGPKAPPAAPESAPKAAPQAGPKTAPQTGPKAAPQTGPKAAPQTGPKTAPSTRPDVEVLAIPGYDSLSASQVVQRLAGLSEEELEAVRAYESGHRGRRTVLTRVSQLQGT